MKRIALIAFMSSVASQATASEIVVGRWCDRMLPNMPDFNRIIEIVINEDDEVIMRNDFADGSSGQDKLEEVSGSRYVKIDSPSGDNYRIVSSSGDLQLLDEDGLIRTATRLENKASSGECR